ncbi:MAG: hypothetical protein LBP68_04190, partial [Acidobacteriota bacterium]|nr:hypothetical protein [Acidobacteriota bacterium]
RCGGGAPHNTIAAALAAAAAHAPVVNPFRKAAISSTIQGRAVSPKPPGRLGEPSLPCLS